MRMQRKAHGNFDNRERPVFIKTNDMEYQPDIVYKTKDYKQFNSIKSNRELDEKHVKALMKSVRVKNMLIVSPIIVNSNLDVIEGQHRLETAERLKVFVYFVVSDTITKKDIAALNSNRKNWKPIDYINYYTIEGEPGFSTLSNFINQNPHFPESTCMRLISSTGNNREYKNGVINVSNYASACKVVEIVNSYRNHFPHAYDRNFILAIVKIMEGGKYEHKVMRQKLEFNSRALVKCVNSAQYIQLIEEIYNYKAKTNTRFF